MKINMDLSIIIPFYKGEIFFPKLIDSLIDSYKFSINKINVEMVIIIDSVETQKQTVESMLFEAPFQYHISKNNENLGVSYSRNIGATIANGKYLSFIDQDDFVGIEYFDILSKYLHVQNDFIVINGYIYNIQNKKKVPIFYFPPKVSFNQLIKRNFIITPGLLIIRKKYINKYTFKQIENYKGIDDWCALLNLLSTDSLKYKFISKKIFFYGLHDNNYSNDLKMSLMGGITLVRKFQSEFPENKNITIAYRSLIYQFNNRYSNSNDVKIHIKLLNLVSFIYCNIFILNVLIGYFHKKLIGLKIIRND
jgi:glycosyltransferase involved in cell wall biosynthesis